MKRKYSLGRPPVRTIRRTWALDFMQVIEDELPQNQNLDYQLFDQHVALNPKAIEFINKLRKRCRIDPKWFYEKILELRELNKRSKHSAEAQEKAKAIWDKLNQWATSRISIKDVQSIFTKFDFPVSWEYSMCWFVLTGRIITPSKKVEVYFTPDLQKIIIEASPDVTRDDVQRIWKKVTRLQHSLKGGWVQSEHKKPKRHYQSDRELVQLQHKTNAHIQSLVTKRHTLTNRLKKADPDLKSEIVRRIEAVDADISNLRLKVAHKSMSRKPGVAEALKKDELPDQLYDLKNPGIQRELARKRKVIQRQRSLSKR